MDKPQNIKQAATTIVARENNGALEVLMVKRHHQIDFFGGAMVFPGGKIHDGDMDPAWVNHAAQWQDVPAEQRGPRIAAIRECFEECGLILGNPGKAVPGPDMRAARQAIDRREVNFIDYVRDMRITLDLAQLTLFSRWLTPPVVPKRFDTFFYLVAAPEGQLAASDGRETVDTEWITPEQALQFAKDGTREIVFPTRMNLKILAQTKTLAEGCLAAGQRNIKTIVPRIVTRGTERFLKLDADQGYGDVEELLSLPKPHQGAQAQEKTSEK